MKKVNCATVPEMPASTPELVATPTSTPCFCRKRMFITVEDTLVAATMLANEMAICSIVAGTSGMASGTDPRVTRAKATAVDVDAVNPSAAHESCAVLSVAHKSERLPTWARITQRAKTNAANMTMFSGFTRRSSIAFSLARPVRSVISVVSCSSRSFCLRSALRCGAVARASRAAAGRPR